MAHRRNDLMKLMQKMNIDPTTFTEDDLRNFEQGQVHMSDSDSEGMRDSVSIADIEQVHQMGKYTTNPVTNEVVNLKNKYSSIVSMLEKQNAFLNAELKRGQAAHEADKQRLISNFRIESDKLLNEIKQLRSKLAFQESQMPMIREALAQVRDMLAGLVPEAVYLRLRDMNEKDMQIQDWILVQVWEIVYPFKKEGEFQKKEILALREELKQITEKHQFLLNDMEHSQKMMLDREEDTRRHKLNYDNSRKAIEMDLAKMQEELGILREKGARFDELNRDYKRLEQEKFLLEEKSGFYDTEKNKNAGGGDKSGSDEAKRKSDLLGQDKEYLTKENIQLVEKVKRLEDKLDKSEKEYLEAKNQAQEYLFQLLNSKTQSSSESEKRIYSEISDLKQKHHHELETAKQNLVDIYEKQIQFLREAKEEIEIRKDSLEGQLKEKQTLYDHLLIDYRNLQRKVDSDMSEQRIQLRLKMEDLERINNIYEDTLANLKATKHENEMLREKINVLKTEYYKCQVEAKESCSVINAQLQVAREQLSNYEGIEREIDEAILKSAGGEYDPKDPLLGFMSSVPTASKRRIQQALNLAQRLQAKQRESEQLYKQIQEKNNEIDRMKEEIIIQRNVIDKTNQPHSYLVAHIEERDRELNNYKQLLKKQDQDYHNLKAEYNDIQDRYKKAEEDLIRLRIKRQNLQNIQNILIGIATGNPNDMRQNLRAAINDMSEALNTNTYMDPQSIQKRGIQTPPQRDSEVPQWYSKLKGKVKK